MNKPTDEQVKKIINDTYIFYKKNKKFLLFRVLSVVLPFADEDTVLPVLQDISHLFMKYKDISKDEDLLTMCKNYTKTSLKEISKQIETCYQGIN